MGFSPHILIFFAIVAGVSRQYRSFSVLFRWRGCHPVLQDFPDTDRSSGEKQISESPDNEKTSLYSIFTGIIQKTIPHHVFLCCLHNPVRFKEINGVQEFLYVFVLDFVYPLYKEDIFRFLCGL